MQDPAIRLLLAKIGLDGHDRGVKLLARAFRDGGIEVIYTGLWQTAAVTAHAGMQEDVDIIGVSLHSAAHMTIMPEVLKWRAHYGIEDKPLVLGGIIPEADIPPLREMGVAAVFNPGSAISDIMAKLSELATEQRRVAPQASDLRERYLAGDINATARLLTHLQRGALPDDFEMPRGTGKLVGITGSPGVGKSSFISRLALQLRERGQRVAVLAVDPTSPITGGALLGDRLRMMRREPDEGFFVRSLASLTEQGGLSPNMPRAVDLLSGAGFDTILVETVGVGQSDTAIMQLTPNVLVLLMPESGDDIQFAKAGIMEIGAGYVVNKCDLPGADTTHRQVLESIDGKRPVWRVSSVHNEGLSEVADWIQNDAASRLDPQRS